MFQIGFDIKGFQLFVLAQVQGMMGMALFGDGPGAVPAGAECFSCMNQIPNAVGKVCALFNDGPPGCPHGGLIRNGEDIAKRLQILPVQGRIIDLFHIVGRGSPLGVDVEHEKAVIAVTQSDALHGFEGIVQGIGLGGGGIDANADKGIFSSGAQQIPVFRVKVGGIQPFFNVIVRRGGVGGFQSLPEGKKLQFRGGNGGNVGH